VQNLSSAATCGITNVSRIPDQAVAMVTALAQIFNSTAPEQERRQAAIDYVRDELAIEHQAADQWPGESFHPQPDFFSPPASADPLLGLTVEPPNPCRKCADSVAIVGPGTSPYYPSLRCRSCGLHRG
jgi:hypothetical protein